MENLEDEFPPEELENEESNGLWLTGRLLAQLQNSSRPGRWLMVLCMFSSFLFLLIVLYISWSLGKLQDEIGSQELELCSTVIILLLFARAVLEGYKSWRLLQRSATDDNALLQGSERLSKMFLWLSLWGGFYLFTLLVEKIYQV